MIAPTARPLAANLEETNVPGVGVWGGTCKCPDGQVYMVGDNLNYCRSMACHGPALALAERLAASKDATARWIGRDAARELQSDKTLARLQRHKARPHTERSAS